jgi:hypothetical protein
LLPELLPASSTNNHRPDEDSNEQHGKGDGEDDIHAASVPPRVGLSTAHIQVFGSA